MVLLLMSAIQPRVAQPYVGEVIFHQAVDILFPFYVVALCLSHDKRINEVIQISADGVRVNVSTLHSFERIGQFRRIRQRTYRRGYDVEQVLKNRLVVYDSVAFEYVCNICLCKKVFQIFALICVRLLSERVSKAYRRRCNILSTRFVYLPRRRNRIPHR